MISVGDIRRAKQKAVGGKKDRCRKGKSCSATCISSWKQCLVEMSDSVSSSLREVKTRVQKRTDSIKSKLGLQVKEETKRRGVGQSLDGKALDNEKLAKRVDEWRKKNSLKKIDDIKNASGHDETHVLIGDYLGRTTKQLANLIGASGTGPSVIEEAFVNTVETLLGKTPKERKQFLQSQEIKSLLKRHFTFLNQMYPTEENKRLLDRSDRVINSFLRVMNRLEQRRDFNQFMQTVSVAREHTKEKALIAERLEKRKQKYEGVKGKLYNELFESASRGDRKKYEEAEKALGKLMSKAGGKFGDKDILEKGSVWEMYSGTLPNKLGQSLAKPGSNTSMNVSGNVVELATPVRGEKLGIRITPSSFLFTVNDSVLANKNIPVATQVAIIRELYKQFPEIIGSMKEGSVVRVSASEGDERRGMREKAYKSFGFSNPDKDGNMFGRIREGKIVPITQDVYEKNISNEFSEKTHCPLGSVFTLV